jgi:hypothetical protein
LKGRNPRPLDDGGPVMPHPAPGPGAAPGSIAAVPPAPRSAPGDPQQIGGPQVHARGALEDVTSADPGEQEPSGSNGPHAPDDEVAVQQGHRDREAHPEGVDRPRALEQQRPTGGEAGASEESADPFAPCLGYLRPEDETARTEHAQLSHR